MSGAGETFGQKLERVMRLQKLISDRWTLALVAEDFDESERWRDRAHAAARYVARMLDERGY